jgi:hypothetical protein
MHELNPWRFAFLGEVMTYRKIGGIHWLFLGRLRISWCFVKIRMPNIADGPTFG